MASIIIKKCIFHGIRFYKFTNTSVMFADNISISSNERLGYF